MCSNGKFENTFPPRKKRTSGGLTLKAPLLQPRESEDSPAAKRWLERLSLCNGCDLCGSRCVTGYPISLWEYQRIKRYLEQLPEAELEKIRSQNKELPWPGAPELTYTACPFRDTERKRCAIYPVRPLICRLFGHVEWLPCPAGIISEVHPRGWQIMQWYARRELRTFEEWEELEQRGEIPKE